MTIDKISNENKQLKENIESKQLLIDNMQNTISKNLIELNEYMNNNQELLRKLNSFKNAKRRSSLLSINDNEKLFLTIQTQKKRYPIYKN